MDEPQVFLIYNTGDLEAVIAFRNLLRARHHHLPRPRHPCRLAWKEPQLEFGDIKYSGRGLPKAGQFRALFLTEHQVIYIRISEP